MTSVNTPECLVVVSDIHGQNDPFQGVVELAEKLDATIVSNGDMIHGPQDLEVVRTLKALGNKAIVLPGNHEWAMFGYLYDKREEYKDVYQDYYFQFLERRESHKIFGLGKQPSREDLKQIIEQEGFGELFARMQMYRESDSVFISHATRRNKASAKRNMTFEALKAAQGVYDDCIKEIGQSGIVPDRLSHKTDGETLFVYGHYHQRGVPNNRIVPTDGRVNLARIPEGKLDALVLYPNGEREIVTVS